MPNDRVTVAASLATHAFQDHWDSLRRFLARRLGRNQDVDDLAQEVFARLLRIHNAEMVRSPLAYLLGIATHVVREFKERSRDDFVIFDSDVADSLGEDLEDHVAGAIPRQCELQDHLERALLELPVTHRLVFLLVKRDGLSYSEAAKTTGLSVHTIEKYLVESRARLRVALTDEGH